MSVGSSSIQAALQHPCRRAAAPAPPADMRWLLPAPDLGALSGCRSHRPRLLIGVSCRVVAASMTLDAVEAIPALRRHRWLHHGLEMGGSSRTAAIYDAAARATRIIAWQLDLDRTGTGSVPPTDHATAIAAAQPQSCQYRYAVGARHEVAVVCIGLFA